MFLIAHGGVGSSQDMDENVEAAVEKGYSEGMDALEAVVGVVKELENDPVFNAGKGSRMRLDGSIQMDAAVMYDGEIGSVVCIENVKNPIDIALEVYDSPFVMLAGSDAREFSDDMGYGDFDPSTEKRQKELEEMKEKLDGTGGEDKVKKMRKFYERVDGGDTVGCVAYIDGEAAAAVSTGGTSYCMRGRVGDSPIVGSGFYVGENGAVVSTGKGEEIVRDMSAKKCHDLISEYGLQGACEKVVDEFGDDMSLGLIAVNEDGLGTANNRTMSQASIE
ncbi:MAG: isoaspartyl peptidase/L-asparaginase [Thermoplasmata archaeon]